MTKCMTERENLNLNGEIFWGYVTNSCPWAESEINILYNVHTFVTQCDLCKKAFRFIIPLPIKMSTLLFSCMIFFFSLCWQKNSCVWRLLRIMMLFIPVLSIAFFQDDKMEICMCFQGCYNGDIDTSCPSYYYSTFYCFIHAFINYFKAFQPLLAFLSDIKSSCLFQRLCVCVCVCVTWQKKRRIYFLYSQAI